MCYIKYTLKHYHTADGINVFERWLDRLADRKAEGRIIARLARVQQGLFGDCKPLMRGVWELRIDHGPGYRVYYSVIGKTVVLLLGGGDKRKQTSDIERAAEYLQDYKRRFDI